VKRILFGFIVIALMAGGARGAMVDQLIADRTAIERVYYQHRTGATAPFEIAVPAETLRRLVEKNLAREQTLRSRYGEEISAAQIAAEVTRINNTTRAPQTLAEIKAALGNDEARFGQSFAKPIVVDRELRRHFENDDSMHAAVRHECELARTNLLAAKHNGAPPGALAEQLLHSHPEAARKLTWVLTPAAEGQKNVAYFDKLPAELRRVLGAQLRNPGDVSAVIETPNSFLLFILETKSEKSLTVAALSLPKLDCDSWLASQPTSHK
jgi:hypothetical protein